MSVNIFGSRAGLKTQTNQNYSSKFISLTQNLQTKVDKNGDSMTGDLNMGKNKVTSEVLPNTDEVLTNRAYVDSKFNIISNLVRDNEKLKLNKAGDVMTGELNMNGQHIVGLENPKGDDEACNKKYVDLKLKSDSIVTKVYIDTLLSTKLDRDIKEDLDMKGFAITNIRDPYDALQIYLQICNQKDDMNMIKLVSIGIIISEFFNKYKNEIQTLNKYRKRFFTNLNYIEIMDSKYSKIDISENISDLVESSTLYSNLKVITVLLIEELPEQIFQELKVKLKEANLMEMPDGRTLGRKYRRFINRCSKSIDPTSMNKEFELLIQKNVLLIDLGFIYFMASLLKKLLDN